MAAFGVATEEIAASKSHWTVAYAAAVIAVNTTMRGADLTRISHRLL